MTKSYTDLIIYLCAGLTLYFLLTVQSLDVMSHGIILFWYSSMSLDIIYTIKNVQYIQYESSGLLRFYLKKFDIIGGTTLQIFTEHSLVFLPLLVSLLMNHIFNIDVIHSGFILTLVIQVLVGMYHVCGVILNFKFIKRCNSG